MNDDYVVRIVLPADKLVLSFIYLCTIVVILR